LLGFRQLLQCSITFGDAGCGLFLKAKMPGA
jgi:hypothetical protein